MKITKIFTPTIMALTLIGCAQTPKKSNSNASLYGESSTAKKHLTREEVESLNKKAIEKVSNRLAELSVAAKASGPDKVRYLASDMYLKASAAMMEGDFQTANLIFKHLLTLVPKDNFIKQKYAVSLIRTGELEEAEKVLLAIYGSSKKKDNKIGLVLAGVHSSLGKVEKSRAVYRKLLSQNPKNEEACIFLSKSFALEKKYKRAVKLLKRCEKRDPKKGIYSYYIGKINVDQKKYKTAKRYFNRAIKVQKDFSQAVMALGLIHEELGNYKLAKKTYIKYLKQSPNDTLILSRLVQLMFSRDELKEVIEYAERLSDYEPDNLNLKVKLGILYKDVKSYEKAITTFKDLLTFAPDNDKILYYLGAIFQEISKYEEAITYYGKIGDQSGLYHDSSFQIAQMLSMLAKKEYFNEKQKGPTYKKFITFIDKKIKELDAFTVDFSVVKAAYYEGLEDNDSAIVVLEKVKEEKAFNNEHRFYLASLYDKQSAHKKATQLVEEILEFDPKNAHAWNFLGYSLLERGIEYDKAYEYIKKAIDLSPGDGYIRDSLGWYYFKTGKTDKALKELREAVRVVPHDVAINKHLAIVYSAKRNFSKAKEYVEKAIVQAQSETERKELNQFLKDLESNRIPASFQNY